MTQASVKERVREFYDSVGWSQIGDGLYQNARYEDLRPVAQEYLSRCHIRVARFLPEAGRYLLDAGSGPIQYPEYLEYSRGFDYRVCLDISERALREARQRIGDDGLFVVGDVANLPFRREAFEGVVSLHTVHHLPAAEHEKAFRDLYRVLAQAGRAVTVYSWGSRSSLMRLLRLPIKLAFSAIKLYRRLRGIGEEETAPPDERAGSEQEQSTPTGTFTFKHGYRWMVETLSDVPGFEIRVWRSVSTSFLRAFIHEPLLGRFWLRLLFSLEERLPRLLGRVGQYPMVLFEKPADGRGS